MNSDVAETHRIDYIIAGTLRIGYVIPRSGTPVNEILSGNLSYSLAGLLLWDQNIGLISRVSRDFPINKLQFLAQSQCDIRGVRSSQDLYDYRTFSAYLNDHSFDDDHPMAHYAEVEHEFPKSLLGYKAAKNSKSKAESFFFRSNDIPASYLDAGIAHICPADIRTHTSICASLKKAQVRTICLDPSTNYMHPDYWNNIHSLIRDVDILIVSETKLRNLFSGRTADVWEMTEGIASMGVQAIVVKCGKNGQLINIPPEDLKFQVPAYPVKIESLMGVGDAFCGGFLAGFKRTYDPLEATLFGNISASMMIENSNPWLMLNPLPGLLDARLAMLKKNIRKL